MKRLLIIAAVVLAAALSMTACGASRYMASPVPQVVERTGVSEYPAAMEAPAAEGSATAANGGMLTGQPSAEELLETRKIIYNASMFLVVEDTEQAAQEISDMAVSMGGYVASMNGYRQRDAMVYDITIRIPAEKFESGRAALRAMAVRVENERVGTDDVTDEYYDLDARLRTLQATEEELTQLLEETRERGGSVEDIMKIYDELVQIRSQIESLQGQLNRLDKLVAFSTIDIHLEPHILAQPIESEGWHPAEIIHSSIASLMAVLTGLATLLIQFVIVVVPVLLLLLAPLALLVWLIHRWQKRCSLSRDDDRAAH